MELLFQIKTNKNTKEEEKPKNISKDNISGNVFIPIKDEMPTSKKQNTTQPISTNNTYQDSIFRIKSATTKEIPTKEKKIYEDLGFFDTVKDIGKTIPKAAAMGYAGIYGFPGLITEIAGNLVKDYQVKKGIAKETDKVVNPLPTYADIMKEFEKYYNYDPKTIQGQYAQTIGEYLPGSGSKLFNLAISGVAGTADEVLTQLASEGYGDIAGFLTYLIGIPKAGKGKISEMVDEALPDEKRMQEAIDLLETSKSTKFPLTTGEAIGGLPFQQLSSDLLVSKWGKDLSEFLEKRQKDLPPNFVKELEDILGTVDTPKTVIATVSDAVESSIKKAEKTRLESANYKDATKEILSKDIFADYATSLEKMIKDPYTLASLKPELKNILKKIKGKSISIDQVQSLLGETQDKIDNFIKKQSMINTGQKLTNIKNDIISIAEAASPAYKNARETYKKISNEIIDPLKETLDEVTKKVTLQKINNLIFNKDLVRPGDITKIANELNKVDKNAFPKMAGYLLESMVDSAVYKSKNPGYSLWGKLFADPKSKNNIITILEESAKSRGINPSGIRPGWNNLIKIFEKMEYQPIPGSATSARGNRLVELGENTFSNILKVLEITKPFNRIDAYFTYKTQKNNMKLLSEILLSDNGFQMIKDLGKQTKKEKIEKVLFGQALIGSRADYLVEENEQP